MRRAYHILDVFTDTPLTGNQLAVVVDSVGLDEARMQAIAREFNLSETVFVRDAGDPVNTARLRIFTPLAELPFAGHPTVGAAALIAHLRAPDHLRREELRVVLEEKIGDIVCLVRAGATKGVISASFSIPRLPEFLRPLEEKRAIAAALSLEESDIGFDAHAPGVWSAGNPLAFIPVASRAAIAKARPAMPAFADTFGDVTGAFLYTREVAREGNDVHARMFAPLHGIPEDPATGSAAAAFAGLAVAYERPEDGDHVIVIEQGFEMGRPSIIHLGVEVEGGALKGASVGGDVVMVAQGFIEA